MNATETKTAANPAEPDLTAELETLLAEEKAAPVTPAPKPQAKAKKAVTTLANAGVPAAVEVVKVKAAKPEKAPPAPANFLMFVGNAFGYTKEEFINESAALGISKRLPSFRLPAALKVGASKVWLAAAGARKSTAEGTKPTGVVFGHFTPDAIEFIAGEDGSKTYADVIATLKKVDGTRVVTHTPETVEAKRLCGFRKVGGTYLVAAKGTVSPLVITPDQGFAGNHFRGMMELSEEQSKALEEGKGLDVLVAEVCMKCTKGFFCSPDGHSRAERERARVAAGAAMKWTLLCPDCNTEQAVVKAKATREANKAAKKEHPILGADAETAGK